MDGIHHAAIFTADYRATSAFYREVLMADAPATCEQPSVIVAGGLILHVFEDADIEADWAPARLHHIGIMTSDLPEFMAVRQRLLDRGDTDGRVQDFGSHVSLLASDPDGGMVEIMLPPDTDRSDLPVPVEPH